MHESTLPHTTLNIKSKANRITATHANGWVLNHEFPLILCKSFIKFLWLYVSLSTRRHIDRLTCRINVFYVYDSSDVLTWRQITWRIIFSFPLTFLCKDVYGLESGWFIEKRDIYCGIYQTDVSWNVMCTHLPGVYLGCIGRVFLDE